MCPRGSISIFHPDKSYVVKSVFQQVLVSGMNPESTQIVTMKMKYDHFHFANKNAIYQETYAACSI